jgi:hypothetical protein
MLALFDDAVTEIQVGSFFDVRRVWLSHGYLLWIPGLCVE